MVTTGERARGRVAEFTFGVFAVYFVGFVTSFWLPEPTGALPE